MNPALEALLKKIEGLEELTPNDQAFVDFLPFAEWTLGQMTMQNLILQHALKCIALGEPADAASAITETLKATEALADLARDEIEQVPA